METDKIWKIRSKKPVFSEKIFEIFEMDCFLPSKNITHRFLSMHLHDWINVFALTDDEKVILVKQHRLGKDLVTVEVPAGAMNRGEDPAEAAKRELEEETGYVSDKMILLKKISVNPAIQDNTCYFFLALGCRKHKDTNFDTGEEIELVLEDKEKIFEKLGSDMVDNSLSFLSIMLARDHLAKRK